MSEMEDPKHKLARLLMAAKSGIIGCLRKRGAELEDAEDVFVGLFVKLEHLPHGEFSYFYLLHAAVTSHIDLIRKRRKEVHLTTHSEEETGDLLSNRSDTKVDIHKELEQKEYLNLLWIKVLELPQTSRSVFLLGCDKEDSVIHLLWHWKVTTHSEIADALAISSELLDQLWNKLPLQDLEIAEVLDIKIENADGQNAKKALQNKIVYLRRSAMEWLGHNLPK